MQIFAHDSAEGTDPGISPATISPARLAANRANAQLSTGPSTPDGKLRSRVNAVKAGLTGATVLLPTEDAAGYERHIRAYEDELHPVGPRECALVQSLADTDWRLNRIPALEAAFYARGHMQFAKSFSDVDDALRPSVIQLETYIAYEKQLRNLHLQESRLHRRRAKDAAELTELQTARQADCEKKAERENEIQQQEIAQPQHEHRAAATSTHSFVSAVGFEFSSPESACPPLTQAPGDTKDHAHAAHACALLHAEKSVIS